MKSKLFRLASVWMILAMVSLVAAAVTFSVKPVEAG
jgi:hypothetical protein